MQLRLGLDIATPPDLKNVEDRCAHPRTWREIDKNEVSVLYQLFCPTCDRAKQNFKQEFFYPTQ